MTDEFQIPQRQVEMAVRQFFRNEFLPKLNNANSHVEGQSYWHGALGFFRNEMGEAVKKVFKMTNVGGEDMIHNLIRQEVSRQIKVWSRDPKLVEAMVEKAIKEEVQAQVIKRLKLRVDGTMHVDVDPDHYKDRAIF